MIALKLADELDKSVLRLNAEAAAELRRLHDEAASLRDQNSELDRKLARQEQEPVAWQWLDTGTFRKSLPASAEPGAWTPLYTAPQRPEWVGLTEGEISEVLGSDIHLEQSGELLFIRAIEAKLREKNA